MQDTLLVLDMLRRLVAAGAPVVPGTEGKRTTAWAGATLHDELGFFREAGLSEARILRAATVDATRALGIPGLTGTIRPGSAADLLLVGADPLEDLAVLRRPRGVMAAGRWYGPETLARMRVAFAGME